MKHILIIASYYPNLKRPLTGIFFHKQVLALKKAGHKVGVMVTPRLNFTLDHLRTHGLKSLRIFTHESDYYPHFPVYRMHWGWFPRPAPFIQAPLVTSTGLHTFDAYCREHGKPDIIHAHDIFYGGYVAAKVGQKYTIPTILTEHSTRYMEGLVIFPGQPAIIRYTLRHIDTSLTVGTGLLKALQPYTPEVNLQTIGNIVDTNLFTPLEFVPSQAAKPFTFAIVSKLEKRKDHKVLLLAFHKAFLNQNVRLIIGGDGTERETLETQVRQLGLEHQVQFLGWISPEKVLDLFQTSDAVVSASKIESFGVTLIEAMACGKPVVATRSGGPEDYVTEESGILVPPGDVDALANAMRQLRDTYAQYNPEKIRAVCVNQFSEQALVGRLEAIYEQAISKHRK